MARLPSLNKRDLASAIESFRFHWPEYLMEAAAVALYLFLTCVLASCYCTPLRQSGPSLVAPHDFAHSWDLLLVQLWLQL